jgi:hypothetical protein
LMRPLRPLPPNTYTYIYIYIERERERERESLEGSCNLI